jgi:predicted ATP-binding protein involved in virulence
MSGSGKSQILDKIAAFLKKNFYFAVRFRNGAEKP